MLMLMTMTKKTKRRAAGSLFRVSLRPVAHVPIPYVG